MSIQQNKTTVLFDVGGTLLHSRSRPYEQVAAVAPKYGYHFDVSEVLQHMDAFQRGRAEADKEYPDNYNMALTLSYSALCRALGVAERHIRGIVRNIQKQSNVPQSWVAFNDTHPTLQSLVAAGFELGVVSNWDENLPDLLDSLNLSQYFSCVVASQSAGVSKPDTDIFWQAMDEMEKDPQECVYIGNDVAQDTSCVLIGMDSMIVDRREALSGMNLDELNAEYDKMGSTAHIRVIRSLGDVEKEIAKQKAMTLLYWDKVGGEEE